MGNRWGTVETVSDFILRGSKITADGDCSHEIKRCSCLGRKVMANLKHIKKQIHYFTNKGPSHQGYILSPCLFNLYAEYIMLNARLDEAQAGIKISERKINNFRYADDTTLMAESEEELKRLLMKEKEGSEKICLKFYIQETKIMAYGPITSWQTDEETMETVTEFIFLGSKITVLSDCSHEINTFDSWRKSYDKPRQHIQK